MRDFVRRCHLVLLVGSGIVFQLCEVKAESTPDRGEALQIRSEQRYKEEELKKSAVQASQLEPKPVQSEGMQGKSGGPPPLNESRKVNSAPCESTTLPVPIPSGTNVPVSGSTPPQLEGAQVVHSLEEKIPDALESIYSNKLYRVLRKWPPEGIKKNVEIPIPVKNGKPPSPVWIRGIKTEENNTYIGTVKQFVIHAPLRRVSAIMLDFEAYPTFYHELKFVRVLAKEGNKITTSWERYSPAFFIANIKYEQIYIFEINEKRMVVRYQLKSANSINFADGLLVLEAENDSTRLTAYDFFDAKWGIFGGLAPGKIWHESFQNSLRDDVALMARAEHPEWSRDQIFKESDRILDLYPVEPIQFIDAPNWGSF